MSKIHDKHIILIGAPHRGKSTLAQLAATRLKRAYFDTDDMAAELAAGSFAAIQAYFEQLQELAVIKALITATPAVISLGAETAYPRDDSSFLKEFGYIIHVRRDAELCIDKSIGLVIKKYSKDQNGEWIEIESFSQRDQVYAYDEELPYFDRAADAILMNNGTVQEGFEGLMDIILNADTPVQNS